jgi:hypothetical protein
VIISMDWMIGFIDNLNTPLGTTGLLPTSPNFTVHCCKYQYPQSNTVSTICFLATVFNTGTITLSLNQRIQILLYHSTCEDFSSLPDFQLSTELSRLHHLPTANSGNLNPILCYNCHLFSLIIPEVNSRRIDHLGLRNRLTQIILFVLLITPRHGPSRKHSLSIVEQGCLPRRCIATVAVRIT